MKGHKTIFPNCLCSLNGDTLWRWHEVSIVLGTQLKLRLNIFILTCNPIFLDLTRLYIQIGIKLHFFLGVELTNIYHHYYGYCDIVIYNKKQIFGLHPHSLVMIAIKVSLLG